MGKESNEHEMKKILQRIAKEDDREAFNIFFRHYHAKLIRFATLFISNYEQAEDVVSNVLVRLLKDRKKVFLMERFEAYLFIAVKNEALNFLKKENRFQMYNLEYEDDFISDEYVNPLKKLISTELREQVTDAVEQLPPKRRMVFKLIKDEGLRYKEVAGLMDISERTVEVHLKLAIKEIRKALPAYVKERNRRKDPPSFLKIAKSIGILLVIVFC